MFLASAVADYPNSKNGMDNDTGNKWNPYAIDFGAGVANKLGPKIGVSGLGDVVQNAVGNVTNPHLQMLYKGVGLREFQFEFIFTPTSSAEAAQVDALIKKLTYWAAPRVLTGASRHYLEPPYLFNIGFSFLGGSGLVSAVTNFFSNLGTQIIGQQLTAALSPSSSLSSALNNAKIYTVYHPCVLRDINVDYAPNGWAAFNDGYPIQTRLTLQFKETDIVTKDDINPGISVPQSVTQQVSAASFGPSAPLSNGVTVTPIDLGLMG